MVEHEIKAISKKGQKQAKLYQWNQSFAAAVENIFSKENGKMVSGEELEIEFMLIVIGVNNDNIQDMTLTMSV